MGAVALGAARAAAARGAAVLAAVSAVAVMAAVVMAVAVKAAAMEAEATVVAWVAAATADTYVWPRNHHSRYQKRTGLRLQISLSMNPPLHLQQPLRLGIPCCRRGHRC